MAQLSRREPTWSAGLLLGIGLGGFLDGILLHQILQVHAMLSAKVPRDTMAGMQTNMLGDGWFHAGTWLVTAAGLWLLWNALTRSQAADRPSGRAFIGWLLAGWGWFNLVEGIVNHHLLGLHHVVERLGISVWDWLFLASGLALIALGHAMARASRTRSSTGASHVRR
jgi:uncharacterized membrane protein